MEQDTPPATPHRDEFATASSLASSMIIHNFYCFGSIRRPPETNAPLPPPGGIAGPADGFFGSSAIMASVVIKRAATEAAFWIAARTTLVGSMMPLLTRLPYSPVWLSKP